MNQADLLNWLQESQRQWERLLEQIGLARMDQPGVAGVWTMKDVVAHLSDWNRHQVARIQAAQRHAPEPFPSWPAYLLTDDEINAWIIEANRDHSVQEVLERSNQTLRQLFVLLEALPDDVRIETVEASGRAYYLVWLDDKRYQPGEFFDHFRDDHESDVRAWLERTG